MLTEKLYDPKSIRNFAYSTVVDIFIMRTIAQIVAALAELAAAARLGQVYVCTPRIRLES